MRPYRLPPVTGLTAAVMFATVLAAYAADTRTSVENRLGLSWEYDDNVLEEPSGKATGGAGLVSYYGRIRIRGPEQLTLLNFNMGYKAHHSLDGGEGAVTAGDVLVNRASVETERRLCGDWTGGAAGELKVRNVYRKNEVNLLSEEGYVRGSGRLFLRHPIAGGSRISLGYRYSFYNFETFDSFNSRAHTPFIQLSRRLSPGLAGSVQYTVSRRDYRRLVREKGNDGIPVELDERQLDYLQHLDLSLAWSPGGRLLNFTWSLQRNSSNNFGFSYWNNRFTLMWTEALPREFFLNAYLFFELKRYSDKLDSDILVDVITEENDNNGAIVKLSRPVLPGLEAALTVSLYRNESSIRELNFRKNLVSTGLFWRF